MTRHEIELNCECPHCGKALYHTVPWLRQNPLITCADCGATMPSVEILGVNTRKVRESTMPNALRGGLHDRGR